ncbi:MAG: hypothetical protein OEV06_12230 [Anaerolineae bacterium]|nr:hypothetical protein [Anaerolineae bacterium]
MTRNDDAKVAAGLAAIARMAIRNWGDGGNAPADDPLGEYIAKKRAEKRNTNWTVSWGKASASYFRGDQVDEMVEHVRWLLSKGHKLRAISRRRGGFFNKSVDILEFDDPPKRLGGLWGFLED